MSRVCSNCGKVHDTVTERKDCIAAHGGDKHALRFGGWIGSDVLDYLGLNPLKWRRSRREPREGEPLDFNDEPT